MKMFTDRTDEYTCPSGVFRPRKQFGSSFGSFNFGGASIPAQELLLPLSSTSWLTRFR